MGTSCANGKWVPKPGIVASHDLRGLCAVHHEMCTSFKSKLKIITFVFTFFFSFCLFPSLSLSQNDFMQVGGP